MAWDVYIKRRLEQALFAKAWRRAQRVRVKAEKLAENFFRDLVHKGIDVAGPPSLGRFTPRWEPLSDDWVRRKFPEDNYYFHTGALQRALLRKTTQNIFGRPQVDLVFGGRSVRVNANQAPQKYAQASGPFRIVLRPFPRVVAAESAEALVAQPGSKTFFKLRNPSGHYFRPLITPFVRWYTHVKMKAALA